MGEVVMTANGVADLLRPKAVARRLEVDPRTLRRMVAAKRFPAADLAVGKKLKWWRRETVESWIAGGRSVH